MRTRVRIFAGLLLLGIAAAQALSAHEVRPALLQINETDSTHYDVLWKQPTNGEIAIRLVPHLSAGELERSPSATSAGPAYSIQLWRNLDQRPVPLEGQSLTIEGLEHSITDVIVSLSLADGRTIQTILRPQQPSMVLELNARVAPPPFAYIRLGIEHILSGIDHLLFVLGLVLLVGGSWALLRTITAFTVAHSLTLAATTFGWIRIPSAVIESLVALSIVILAVELVRQSRGESGITTRFPWLIAFSFGLLHGCAFAGALAEVGLPARDVPLALLFFNVGVEIGQLLFVAAVLLLIRAAKHLIARSLSWPGPSWPGQLIPYLIGSFAAYWFIDRLLTSFSGAHLQS